MKALDYSSGAPSALSVLKAGYGAVVRYIGTPGRIKNLKPMEAQDMRAHAVAIALVYEDSSGTALQGRTRGVQDARAALDDARRCGIEPRALYLAVDFDVTSAGQMAAIDAYLDGAAQVLGRARTGVYGEYDVIEHCLGNGRAVWGWQTRAWSHGKTSARAHIVQELGQVNVDGVSCDVNTVHREDYGQTPAPSAPNVAPATEGDEDDVKLYVCDKAVYAGGPGYWRHLTPPEYDAWRAAGYEVHSPALTATQRDHLAAACLALRPPTVDAAALAKVVVAALPAGGSGGATAAELEAAVVAGVRQVLTEGTGGTQ